MNERLGLVAAAQDTEHSDKAIRISNFWTGKMVREFSPPVQKGASGKGAKIRDLKWMDDDDGGVRLWGIWGRGIAEFAW